MNDMENDTFSDDMENPLKGYFYRLSGKKPVPCSLDEYMTFMKSAANRIIEQTPIGDLLVSTIFTGIDHAFGTGEKRLFETKVFGLPDDIQPRWRYSTWNQAIREHRRLVVMLENKGMEALAEEIRKQPE